MKYTIFCLLFAVLAIMTSCTTTLDRHVQYANEYRVAGDESLPALRERCPSATIEDPACEHLYETQHATADAHEAWVDRLAREVAARRWRHPHDSGEVATFCAHYTAFVARAAAAGVILRPLSDGATTLCTGDR